MATDAPIVVRGHSGHLIVPAVAIPGITLGAFTYYRDTLPDFCTENAAMIVSLSALLTAALVALMIFRRDRRITVAGAELRYETWLTKEAFPAGILDAVTIETEVTTGSDQTTTENLLTFWSGDSPQLKLDTSLWPHAGLRDVLIRLRQLNPGLKLDRSVERLISGKST